MTESAARDAREALQEMSDSVREVRDEARAFAERVGFLERVVTKEHDLDRDAWSAWPAYALHVASASLGTFFGVSRFLVRPHHDGDFLLSALTYPFGNVAFLGDYIDIGAHALHGVWGFRFVSVVSHEARALASVHFIATACVRAGETTKTSGTALSLFGASLALGLLDRLPLRVAAGLSLLALIWGAVLAFSNTNAPSVDVGTPLFAVALLLQTGLHVARPRTRYAPKNFENSPRTRAIAAVFVMTHAVARMFGAVNRPDLKWRF